jgi:hypothetical protein
MDATGINQIEEPSITPAATSHQAKITLAMGISISISIGIGIGR